MRPANKRCALAGWVALCLVCAGCTAPAPPGATSRPGGIIAFSPNITETLFALGQGSRVVGVTNFCDYPPEVQSLARVGGYIDPDLEKITALAPGLIILGGKYQEVSEVAAKNGIEVLHINMDSLASIDEGIAVLGNALRCEAEAQALRARIRKDVQAVRDAVHGRTRPRVLIISARQSHDLNNLFTVGGRSFVSELVDVAGGDNIFAEATQAYFEASKETVVLKGPEVIIEFHAGESLTAEEQARYIADWDQLGLLPAVKARRVYLILESYALRPGPRVGQVARRIASLLHPDVSWPEP